MKQALVRRWFEFGGSAAVQMIGLSRADNHANDSAPAGYEFLKQVRLPAHKLFSLGFSSSVLRLTVKVMNVDIPSQRKVLDELAQALTGLLQAGEPERR